MPAGIVFDVDSLNRAFFEANTHVYIKRVPPTVAGFIGIRLPTRIEQVLGHTTNRFRLAASVVRAALPAFAAVPRSGVFGCHKEAVNRAILEKAALDTKHHKLADVCKVGVCVLWAQFWDKHPVVLSEMQARLPMSRVTRWMAVVQQVKMGHNVSRLVYAHRVSCLYML